MVIVNDYPHVGDNVVTDDGLSGCVINTDGRTIAIAPRGGGWVAHRPTNMVSVVAY